MQSDYLEIGWSDGRPAKRYCTTKDKPLPEALTTTSGGSGDSSQMRLTFQSDGVFDATGFEALYEFTTFEPSMSSSSCC